MAPVFNNLSDPIFHYARTKPETVAIIEGDHSLTYLQFAGLVGRAAVHLHDLGVKPGELVAVSLPVNVPHLVLVFALLRIGAIPVDVPFRQPQPLDPHTLFGVRRAIALPGYAAPEGVVVHTLDADWKAAIETKNGDFRFSGPSDNLLIFSITSGTTGAPKGVVTTQREWWERTRSAAALLPEVLDVAHPPHLLVMGEMSFSGFFFFVANQICVGGPLVLVGVVASIDTFIDEINKRDDTVFLVTPPICREMLAKASGDGVLLPKVRAMIVGAAPLYPEEKQRMKARLTPNLIEVYGNAATGFISALRPADVERKSESVGRVAPGIAVDIVDERGRIAPPGAIGYVRCRGSGVTQRFIGAAGPAAAGPEGVREGSFYPGDLGALDGEGYLYLKGRVTDLIRRGAITIYPPEIEAALASCELVAEAAVFGLSASDGGEQVVAVIVPRGEPDLEAVAAHCKTRLPPEKLPNQLFWVNALPKTGPGKIDKVALKANVAAKLKAAAAPAAAEAEAAAEPEPEPAA